MPIRRLAFPGKFRLFGIGNIGIVLSETISITEKRLSIFMKIR